MFRQILEEIQVDSMATDGTAVSAKMVKEDNQN